MTANYNEALFRQLQAPTLDKLKKIEVALDRLAKGQIQPKDLGVVELANEIASGLSMIGRQVVARLAKSIEKGLRALSHPEKQGWDHIQVQAVTRALLDLVKAFTLHLRDMGPEQSALHVRLWPVWRKLSQAMEETVEPKIEDLFEIDADFGDETFRPRPAEYLQTTLAPLREKLSSAITKVETARSRSDMEEGLRKATEVFNQVYAVRHRRPFQTYWLIIKARLALGLMHPADLLEQQPEWLVFLRDVNIQLMKFSEDYRRIGAEKLDAALRPLLKPWPAGWVQAHPALTELDRRLGLGLFWQAAQEIAGESSDGTAARFASRQKELEAELAQAKSAWNKVVDASIDQRPAAVAAFLRVLGPFLPKRGWLPGGFVDPLFEALGAAGDQLAAAVKEGTSGRLEEALAFEVASSLLMLEEVIERHAKWSQELEARIRHQAQRLHVAVLGRGAELQAMAPSRWDAKWREQQVENAIRSTLSQLGIQLGEIEKALSGLSRGDDVEETQARFPELAGRCRQMGLVLTALREPLASRLAEGMMAQIEALAKTPKAPHEAGAIVAKLATAVAAMKHFLQVRKGGEKDTDHLLAAGIDAVLSEGEYGRWTTTGEPTPVVAPAAPVAPLPADTVAAEHEEPAASSASAADAHDLLDGLVPSPEPASPPPTLRVEEGLEHAKKAVVGEGTLDRAGSEEIVAVFLEEADVALAQIDDDRAALGLAPNDEARWESLRRQFHTLKGSARICGLWGLGEVAWWVEERLSDGITLNETYADGLDNAVGMARDGLQAWFDALRLAPQAGVRVQAVELRQVIEAAAPVFDPRPSSEPETAHTPDLGPPQAEPWASGAAAADPDPEPESGPVAAVTAPRAMNAGALIQRLDDALASYRMSSDWDWDTVLAAGEALLADPTASPPERQVGHLVVDWARGRAVAFPVTESDLVTMVKERLAAPGPSTSLTQAFQAPEWTALLGTDATQIDPPREDASDPPPATMGVADQAALDRPAPPSSEPAAEELETHAASVEEGGDDRLENDEEGVGSEWDWVHGMPQGEDELPAGSPPIEPGVAPEGTAFPVPDAAADEVEDGQEDLLTGPPPIEPDVAPEGPAFPVPDAGADEEEDGQDGLLTGPPPIEPAADRLLPPEDAAGLSSGPPRATPESGYDPGAEALALGEDPPAAPTQGVAEDLPPLVGSAPLVPGTDPREPPVTDATAGESTTTPAQDEAWEDVFEAFATIRQGIEALGHALLKVSEQDRRD